MFSVLTLGPVAVCADGTGPIDLGGARSREVVAAIASGAGQPVQRQKLWSWLWPDLPRDQARKALNTEIWRLRRTVVRAGGDPDALILSTPQDLRLSEPARSRCDIAAFRARLDHAGSLDEMMQLARSYRGEFAEGLDAEWLEDIRRELRAAFLGLLHRIVAQAMASNRLGEAQLFAEKMNAEDPYDETAIRARMRAALAAGDRGGAARAFREFSLRLRADLDVTPTARTLAVYHECQGQSEAPEPMIQGSPGFRIEHAPPEALAVADARRKLLAIADLVTAIRRDLRAIARDLDSVDS